MTRPAPYPADTKAKGWRFELDLEQVMQSDTWALAKPEARPWLLMLWTKAWQQTPCGSMPSDEELIIARLEIDPEFFEKHKRVLLRGWVVAEDGRLYHPTITQRVNDMLGRKTAERTRKAEYRARMDAERKLAELQGSPEMSHGTDAGQSWESGGCDATGTGTGTGTGLGISNPPSRARSGENLSRGTDAGRICKLIKSEGIADTNPGHETLRVLIEAGATDAEFIGAAKKAKATSKGFAYVLGIVTGDRKRANELAGQIHRGAMPSTQATETPHQQQQREHVEALAPGAARKAPGGFKNPFVVDITEVRNVPAIASR